MDSNQTPSETFHVLDMWKFNSYRYGVTSGTVWYGYQVSPFQLNTKLEKGELVVMRDETPYSQDIHCVGPGK